MVRASRYAETPVGRNPSQIDYADFALEGAVKTLFRWTVSRPNGRFTVQIEQTQQARLKELKGSSERRKPLESRRILV